MRVLARLRVLAIVLCGLLISACEESGSDGSSNGAGRGGSTARMVVIQDYLYAIADGSHNFSTDNIQLFDVSAPESPNPWVRVSVDWQIETLFPYGDYLLIGAADGMHIMDNTDKANPRYVVKFEHATARDPVVARDGFAYVTLASNFGGPNELLIVDINEIENPQLVETLAMQEPGGLAITDEELFVCDGASGLKIFDRNNPVEISVKETITGIECNDVIVQDERLIVITDNALLQYEHGGSPAVLLSRIDHL